MKAPGSNLLPRYARSTNPIPRYIWHKRGPKRLLLNCEFDLHILLPNLLSQSPVDKNRCRAELHAVKIE